MIVKYNHAIQRKGCPFWSPLRTRQYNTRMNTNDKYYVDRLYNQQVNELNEIKNRLLILEGKTAATPEGNIQVEIDTEKVYEMFLKACHDSLQQRQERLKEEDRKAAEKLRQECEAKDERYFSNVHEWRAAIARDYDEFFRKMLGLFKIADRRYRDIRSALLKLLGESSTSTNEASKNSFIFSNLPSGITPKLTEIRHRLAQRIHTYLSGTFTLYRGWTILAALLYFILLIVLLSLRLTFSFSS